MNNPTINPLPPLPSLVSPSHSQQQSSSSVMSPLTAILSLLILIAIPGFIYAFFFAINCSIIPSLGRLLIRTSGESTADELSSNKIGGGRKSEANSGVRYNKETNGGDCAVCLSAFVEGDYVKKLENCEHSFHVVCIDKWLYSHSSCPVCRASVSVKVSVIPKTPLREREREREDDLHQGLPDAATLV